MANQENFSGTPPKVKKVRVVKIGEPHYYVFIFTEGVDDNSNEKYMEYTDSILNVHITVNDPNNQPHETQEFYLKRVSYVLNGCFKGEILPSSFNQEIQKIDTSVKTLTLRVELDSFSGNNQKTYPNIELEVVEWNLTVS